MKIIDLFYNIMTDEKVPQKIKYHNKIWELDTNKINGYFDYINCDNRGMTVFFVNYLYSNPNDEVEILEEEKKIPKPLTKKDIEALGYACGEIEKCFKNGWNKSLENKPLEEKKIPEKLKMLNANDYSKEVYYENYSKEEISLDIETLQNWVNKIIDYLDYLKSKGDE